MSIARKESTEWEIEHKYVSQELLRVQAALAKAIMNNPMATAKDRAVVTMATTSNVYARSFM